MEYNYDYMYEEKTEEQIFQEKLATYKKNNNKIVKLVFGILFAVYSFVGIILGVVGFSVSIIELLIPGAVLLFCGIFMLILMFILPKLVEKYEKMTLKEYESKYLNNPQTFYRGNPYYTVYLNTQIDVLKNKVQKLEEEVKSIKR